MEKIGLFAIFVFVVSTYIFVCQIANDIHWFRKVIENGVAIAVERKEDE